MTRTYYDVLGVGEDADDEAIRAAYRERVKETHPDRSDDPDAGRRFRRVRQAKEVLTDPDERRRYDRVGHGRYVGDGTGTTDGSGSGGSGRQRSESTRGESTDGQRRAGNRQWESASRGRRSGYDGSTADAGSANAHRRRRRARRKHAEARRERRRDTAGWGTDRATAGSATAESRGGPAWNERGAATAGAAANDATASGATTTGAAGKGATDAAAETVGYRVVRSDPPGPDFTPSKVGLAAATFLLYPLFLGSAVLPAFPLAVNVVVGICTLLLVTYLLSMPEAGVLVFGGWTLLGPVLLTVTGVGLLSPAGFFLWAACWLPCTLAAANLAFLST